MTTAVTSPSQLLEMRMPPPNLRSVPFPWRLHEMLDAAGNEGFESIVSWLPDGRSFRVHDPVSFVDKVMKKFFNQNKYKSFQRQLNIWGFVRILDGPMKGGYMHHHLAQGQPELCAMMKRQKIKGAASGATTAVVAVAAPVPVPPPTMAVAYPATTITVPHTQTAGMMRSVSLLSASSDTSVSSETSSLTVPMFSSEPPQVQALLQQPPQQAVVVAGHHQQQPQLQQLQVYGGNTAATATTTSTSQFEGQMFFLLGEDLPQQVAPPPMTFDETKTTVTNTYRANRRLSVQLFAASQGENTGMPGIEQLFADLESGTDDALDIFNRSIAR